MSKFRTLVEGMLSNLSLSEDWETSLDWSKNNPYDDDDTEEYKEWVESQSCYTMYAIRVGESKEYGKLYARFQDGWETTNVLSNEFDDEQTVWKTAKEAIEAANKYKEANPNEDPRVVTVYSDDDREYFEDKEKIFTYEDWKAENY